MKTKDKDTRGRRRGKYSTDRAVAAATTKRAVVVVAAIVFVVAAVVAAMVGKRSSIVCLLVGMLENIRQARKCCITILPK